MHLSKKQMSIKPKMGKIKIIACVKAFNMQVSEEKKRKFHMCIIPETFFQQQNKKSAVTNSVSMIT